MFASSSMVSRATPPLEPSKPNKLLLLAVGALFATLIGFAGPLVSELLFNRRLHCRDDFERNLGLPVPIDLDLSDALIAHCNLSGRDVERITEAMRSGRQGFCEAALELQLATREDIADVSHWAREQSRRAQPGVIEAAIRSAQGGTALTVRQGMARLSSELIHARDADNERGEKIRGLRTDLMLLNESAQRGNIFALLSPGRGEGRSQLCAELAIAFAQLGRRTLLVDADLRHPRQHVLFTADNQWGD